MDRLGLIVVVVLLATGLAQGQVVSQDGLRASLAQGQMAGRVTETTAILQARTTQGCGRV